MKSMVREASEGEKEWLILELANTAGFRALADRPESIQSFADMLEWCAEMKLLSPAQRRQLGSLEENERDRVLRRLRSFRDAIQSLLSRLTRQRPPAKADVILVSDEIRAAMAAREMEVHRGRIVWTFGGSSPETIVLGASAISASELLASEDLHRLRECSGRDCARLYVDRSRNATRRWCSMAGCGNRAKARRHYRRSREKTE